MYSVYKLYKQGDNVQPWRTSFPILNQSILPCPVLKCCLLTYTQISPEAGKVVCYSLLFMNFPQFVVIHRVQGFSVVNEADVFLELSCFFDDPVDVGNLFSCSSAFSILNIWKFLVHVLLKPSLENFEHCFASVWDECNCAVVWAFFGIAFLWDWNENWPFPVLWPSWGEISVAQHWRKSHDMVHIKHLIQGKDSVNFPVELFQILKDDAVKVLHSI